MRLLRRTGSPSPTEGIYHCKVNNTMETFQTFYVGLYSNAPEKGMSNIIDFSVNK